MDGLLGYEIWFNISYLSIRFMCNENHDLVNYLFRIESLKLFENTPLMLTLSLGNIIYFMKC